ncbi:hypothetical protein [Streptosporangium sp. CA-115845]|uniref:hypothetical protein n=1 Tax=Streptosporangium sp. CA-115845 TaxID=3240071 RepID=UPI003D8FEA5E
MTVGTAPTAGMLLVLGVASFAAVALGARSLAWLVVGLLAMEAAVGTHLPNMSVGYGSPPPT